MACYSVKAGTNIPTLENSAELHGILSQKLYTSVTAAKTPNLKVISTAT
jgi:hypothetical protein